MIRFKDLFEKSTIYPRIANYKNKQIFEVDKFPVSNKETLIVSIEKTNSKYTQGVAIDIYGYCKVLGKINKKDKHVNMLFWEDAELMDPKNIEIDVYTKEPFVYVQNIWEDIHSSNLQSGEKTTCYVGIPWYNSDRWPGSAMYSEEIENGKRYFCSDGDSNENFDSIVFTVKRLKK